MGKRWPSLAVGARTKNILDFSKITHFDKQSLLLEGLIFEELERERLVQYVSHWFNLVHLAQENPEDLLTKFMGEMRKLVIPWKVDTAVASKDITSLDEVMLTEAYERMTGKKLSCQTEEK